MAAEFDSDSSVPQILTLEREILRSLCSARASATARDAVLRSLAHHAWHDPEHRIVYEALTRMRGRGPAAVREELPATVTRMGFPDVDWKQYWVANEIPGHLKIKALVRALTTAAGSLRR
jgi:hypothetical protein